LRNSIEGNDEFAVHIKPIKHFQGIKRKNAAIRRYGKARPDFPETH
jgi:hypothetical protein